MTLRSDLRENRWLRAQFATFISLLATMIWLLAWPPSSLPWPFPEMPWMLAPTVGLAATGLSLWVPSRRREKALLAAKELAAAEAAELRTPRAPDAGMDQCPVCGCYGLTELAADDLFMERGERALVVAWGRKRAHWDCAEFVPYVAPPHFKPFEVGGVKNYCGCKQCHDHGSGYAPGCATCRTMDDDWLRRKAAEADPGYMFAGQHGGVHYTCRYCKKGWQAPSMDIAQTRLIAHSKVCEVRCAVTGEDSMAGYRSRMLAEYMAAESERLAAKIRAQSPEPPSILRMTGQGF